MRSGLSRKKAFISAVVCFAVLAFLANWSLLLGENLMKYDIWDAEYPLQVFTTDAIWSGTLPLWNPLMNYGTPTYAMIGIPVWYPITFLLDLIGYGTFSPAWEYCIHLVIGGLGAFLLGIELLCKREQLRYSEFAAVLGMGILYEFSGVMLSNAQHIMIIISAAWIPFVLLCVKRYVVSHRIFYGMSAGICAGLILFGGYPELFYDLFLVLIPWCIYWEMESDRKYRRILTAGIRLFVVAFCSILFAAITVIPFVHIMPLITRNSGQEIMTFSFESIFSALLPMTSDVLSGQETSMGLYYIGFATIFAIPALLKYRNRDTRFYLGLSACALFLSFGANSFFQNLMWRFLPVYSTFRFASLWRVFFALFAMLAVAVLWIDIFDGKSAELIGCLGRFWKRALAAWVIAVAILYFGQNAVASEQASTLQSLCNAMLLTGAILLGYYYFIVNVCGTQLLSRAAAAAFVVLISAEALCTAYKAFPVTIARYDASTSQQEWAQNDIAAEETAYEERDKSTEFSGKRRTSNVLNSNYIVRNKTFDEGGYVSVKLQSTEDYKNSYNRTITQQNPEIFFTNDIVDSAVTSLESWREQPSNSSYQIYVKNNTIPASENRIVGVTMVLYEQPLEVSAEGNQYHIAATVTSQSETATKIRLYFDADTPDTVQMSTAFVQEADGGRVDYNGEYSLKDGEGNRYVDLSLPRADTSYSEIYLSSETPIIAVTQIELQRETQDSRINVLHFGFNSIEFEVDTEEAGIATILQANYSGWNAYIDGEKADIVEVDGCFMGVSVSAGQHTIVLKFRPWDFALGAAGSGLFIAGYVYVAVRRWKKRRNEGTVV